MVIPYGSKLRITKIGDIRLNDNLILKNVMYVPKIPFNLISVHKLCTDNNISSFFIFWLLVPKPLQENSLTSGNLKQGLYYTLDKRLFKEINTATSTPKS